MVALTHSGDAGPFRLAYHTYREQLARAIYLYAVLGVHDYRCIVFVRRQNLQAIIYDASLCTCTL